MKTRDSAGFQGFFLEALEESPIGEEKDREGALKAWVTRHANEGYAEAERAKALRAAGDDVGARVAERNVDRAARKLNEKLKVLQDHVGREVKLRDVVGRRLAGAFEGKINVGAPAAKAPAVIDTAQRMGVRQRVMENAPKAAWPAIPGSGMAPPAPSRKAEPAQPEVKKPEPKPKEQPKEYKHDGPWAKLREEYKQHREKAREAGFERVDIQHPEHNDAAKDKVVAYEFLEHADGRRIEYHLEHNKGDNLGKLKIIEHPSDIPVFEPGGPKKNPMVDVKDNVGMMQAAHADPKLIESHSVLGSPDKGMVGETFKVKFKDGSAAIYKPHKSTGIERYKGMGGLGQLRSTLVPNKNIGEKHRDLAAYKISEAAGFNIVPHIELVDYKIGTPGGGHAMAFIEGKVAADAHWQEDARGGGHPDIHRIAALDFITGNTDRHAKNFMKGKSGRYYAIDNGLAFPDDMNGREYRSSPHYALAGKAIPKEVQSEIAALRPEHIAAAMKESGFTERDITSAQARAKAMVGMTKWGDPDEMWGKAAKVAGVKLAGAPRGGGW